MKGGGVYGVLAGVNRDEPIDREITPPKQRRAVGIPFNFPPSPPLIPPAVLSVNTPLSHHHHRALQLRSSSLSQVR